MKRGTPDHPKTIDFAKRLGCSRPTAVGILELLWHHTARYAPQGDIGRWDDATIAAGIGWEGDTAALMRALVDAEWLDEHPKHRLLVHDWHEHADEAVKKNLLRSGKPFLTGRTTRERGIVPSIYFVQAEGSGAIKIGHTEVSVESRIAALQTGSAERLRLLCAYPGRRADELALHKRFAPCCITSEWFRPEADLLSFVQERLTAAGNGRQRPTTAKRGRQRHPASAVARAGAVAGAVASAVGTPDGDERLVSHGEPPPTAATPEEAKALAIERLGPPTPPTGNGGPPREVLTPEQRVMYVNGVWSWFIEQSGQNDRVTSPAEYALMARWMDMGIPLRVACHGIEETKGTGNTLNYYGPSVQQEYDRWLKIYGFRR